MHKTVKYINSCRYHLHYNITKQQENIQELKPTSYFDGRCFITRFVYFLLGEKASLNSTWSWGPAFVFGSSISDKSSTNTYLSPSFISEPQLLHSQTSSANFGEHVWIASATVRNIFSSPMRLASFDACTLSITTGPGFARTSCWYKAI